jgi:SAM-dependent methyltransferase
VGEQPHYSTWIRTRKIFVFWAISLALVAAGLGLALVRPWLGLISLAALPFVYIALVISLSAFRFSPRGGDFQNRIHGLLVDAVAGRRKVLDVGCGSGHLLIKIAKANPGTHKGIDYWGDEWAYSKTQCETNARIEGVAGLEFMKASASKLPFADGSFDAVVSCLTFHEVLDVADKTVSVREALRVLSQGGRFAFVDLFDDPGYYPDPSALARAIEQSGGVIESRRPLRQMFALPFPLGLKKVLGHAALVTGRRAA